jgi:hypothetical protein
LRRELGDAVRIHETRSLAEAWQALAAAPASFVVVELTAAGREGLVRRMLRMPREFPLARVAVVAAPPLALYEAMVRQAGAVHFTCSGRRLAPLAAAIARHLAAVPQSPTSLTEQIWAALPWAIAR